MTDGITSAFISAACPAIRSMQTIASSSALCASIGPEVTSPITQTPGAALRCP